MRALYFVRPLYTVLYCTVYMHRHLIFEIFIFFKETLKKNKVHIELEIRAIRVNNVYIYCNAVGTYIEGMVTNMAQHAENKGDRVEGGTLLNAY